MKLLDNAILAGSSGKTPSLILLSQEGMDNPVVLSEFPAGHSIYALALSGSLDKLAAGTRAGYLRVFDNLNQESEEEVVQPSVVFDVFHTPSITSLDFLTNDILVSGSLDGTVKFWSISEKTRLASVNAHEGGVFAVRCLGKLIMASIGADGTMRIWDLDTLKSKDCCRQINLPKFAALISLDYDYQSGKLMHPTADGQIFLYDVKNDFALKTVDVHTGQCMALSCSKGYIATAGYNDTTIKVFKSGLSELVAQRNMPKGVLSLAWSGDNFLAAVLSDYQGHIFRFDNGYLHDVNSISDYNLRTVASRNCELSYTMRKTCDLSWRDKKLNDAVELLVQERDSSDFYDLLADLARRGFETESFLLICAAASSQNQQLIKLKSLMALVEILKDSEVVIEFYFCLVQMLLQMNEPQLAGEYIDRILALSPEPNGLNVLIEQIENSPYTNISPDSSIRRDFKDDKQFTSELEKYTFLKRKFLWPVVFTKSERKLVNYKLNADEIISGLIKKTDHSKLISEDLEPTNKNIFSGSLKKNSCFYLYKFSVDIPVYFVLELQSLPHGFCFRPYGVIEFSSLNTDDSGDSDLFNRQVQDIWFKVKDVKVEKWFQAKALDVSNYIMEIVGGIIALKEPEF